MRPVLSWALAGTGLLLAAIAAFPELRGGGAGGDLTRADVERALAEGNRLVRAGRPEEAIAAYGAGWPADRRRRSAGGAAAVLAYNLGATAHRLHRLPEAILWYRRAEAARLDDPWLAENLGLARAEASATVRPTPDLGRLAAHTGLLATAAAALAWAALVFFLLAVAAGGGPRRVSGTAIDHGPGRRRWAVAGGAALILWAAAAALDAWAPRPAVLLEPCQGPAGTLPAASEIWVGGEAGGGRKVVGGPRGQVCADRILGLVE